MACTLSRSPSGGGGCVITILTPRPPNYISENMIKDFFGGKKSNTGETVSSHFQTLRRDVKSN